MQAYIDDISKNMFHTNVGRPVCAPNRGTIVIIDFHDKHTRVIMLLFS
jgi:hypothetical protein